MEVVQVGCGGVEFLCGVSGLWGEGVELLDRDTESISASVLRQNVRK